MDDLTRLSIRELRDAYATRQVRVEQVVESYLARIDALDPELQSYVTVTAYRALEQARELDRHGYQPTSPLYGVPVAPKDLFQTAGVRTTAGSRILADWIPTEDATAVRRLRAAGAVSLGKLNTHEFAFGGTTQTWERKTRNPWDRGRVPGGSSGGTGAALAADLCAASIGTDTGGSGRIPAHCCGAVGLKPTYGRVSRFGVVPLSWNLDHVAPMARTVEDVAIVLQAIAGPDPLDLSTLDQPALVDLTSSPPRGPLNVRVGLDWDLIESLCSSEVLDAFRFSMDVLVEQGARVVQVQMFDLALAEGAQWAIIAADAAAYHRHLLQERLEDYGEDVATELLAGTRLSATDYVRGQQIRRLVADHFQQLFQKVEVVAMPVMSTVAPTFEEASQWAINLNGRELPLFTVFTGFCLYANLTGVPALAIPCRARGSGLPIAFQLLARAWDEATLVRLGSAYQASIAWEQQRPVLAVSAQ
jgi:aspartyl-tRNA(Asn)/glutamyl-tRNA(Gln) amidotransferase subunit A